MNAVLFLFRKETKNTVRKALKNPAALIGYLLFFAFYLWIGTKSGDKPKESESFFIDGNFFFVLLNVSSLLMSFAYLYPNVKAGISGFRTADVPLLFTAPLRTFDILLSLLLRQFMTGAFTLFFFLAQIPLFINIFGLSTEGVVLYVLSTLIMNLYGPIIMIFKVFSLRNRPRLASVLKVLFLLTLGAIALIPIIPAISSKDPFNAYIEALKASWIDMIPIVGWIRAIGVSPMTGLTTNLIVDFGLFTILCTGILVYLHRQKDTEWFEETAQITEQNGIAMESMKKGSIYSVTSSKRKKAVAFTFTAKGSAAIFQKHLLEYRKTGFWFVNFKTILFLLFGGGLGWLMSTSPDEDIPAILLGLLLLSFISIFFALFSRWNREVRSPYLYLIPDHPVKKLMMITAASSIKHLIDGLFFFIPLCIFCKGFIPDVIICVLAYVLVNQSYVSLDIIINRLFGRLNANSFRVLINYFTQMLMLIPAIVVGIIISEAKLPYTLSLLGFTAVIGVFYITLSVYASIALRYPEYFE